MYVYVCTCLYPGIHTFRCEFLTHSINLSLESSHVSSIACRPGLLSNASFLICLLSFCVSVKAMREDGPPVTSTPRRLQLMFTHHALTQQQRTAWRQPAPRVRRLARWGAPWERWGMPPATSPCSHSPGLQPWAGSALFLWGAACVGAAKERCCRRIPSIHLLLMTVIKPTLPFVSRIYWCSNKWSIFEN